MDTAGSERLHGPGDQERQPGVRVQPRGGRCGDPADFKARQPMACSLQLHQSGEVTSSGSPQTKVGFFFGLFGKKLRKATACYSVILRYFSMYNKNALCKSVNMFCNFVTLSPPWQEMSDRQYILFHTVG